MENRNSLIKKLDHSRAKIMTHLDEVDKNRKIYPLWTIREILAHLSGWDDAVIASINSLKDGERPATPASRGIDHYNAETVATREGLDYDHIYREFVETRKVLTGLLEDFPENLFDKTYVLPWGARGTVIDIVDIFSSHEEEHAEDVARIIEEGKKTN